MSRGSERLEARSVTALFEQYLRQQIEAQASGLGYPCGGEEVSPYDATPLQPIDPQSAWSDAVRAGELLGASGARWGVPPEWPTLVQQQETAVAIAFALGNYPQLVRQVQPLLTGQAMAMRQAMTAGPELPELVAWGRPQREEPRRYLAAGVLRLARQFDAAEALLAAPASQEWQAIQANEVAALIWHRGLPERALAAWMEMPESVPVRFNRGMAALFVGQKELARVELSAALRELPETSAWHHLACLYRTMAEE